MRILLVLLLLVSLPGLAGPPAVRLSPRLTGADLLRIRVGHQAGILKIYARDLKTVTFIKGSATADADVLGIDGVKWAPLSGVDRDALLAALNITPAEAELVSSQVIKNAARLPQLEAVALLGALASPGDSTALPAAVTQTVVRFLQTRLGARETIQVRRQAVLSLALIPTVDFPEVEAVINFMKRSRNGWETFTTVQFFDHHKSAILAMERLPEIKQLLKKSGNPRAEGILENLEQ